VGEGGARARAKGEGGRAAGRSSASLPSARSVRYAISQAGHVCVTLTFTLLPLGVYLRLPCWWCVTTVAVIVNRRVVCGA